MAQTLNFNGIQAGTVTFNGVVVSNVYFNGSLVFGGSPALVGFVSTWKTTSNNETITLPTTIFNYEIDWGDGTITNNTNFHEYATAGTYVITMPENVTNYTFNFAGDNTKILSVENWGGFILQGAIFGGCSNLTNITATDNPLLGVSVFRTFRGCTSLVQINGINNWNFSTVTNMQEAFRQTAFNDLMGDIDISNVTSLNATFQDQKTINQDISVWDYSSVTNMVNFMNGKGSEYNPLFMDNLYIKLDQDLVFANMVFPNISFGTINYTSAGAAARASLVSKGFIITSGGEI